jgi:hypothetical protein
MAEGQSWTAETMHMAVAAKPDLDHLSVVGEVTAFIQAWFGREWRGSFRVTSPCLSVLCSFNSFLSICRNQPKLGAA